MTDNRLAASLGRARTGEDDQVLHWSGRILTADDLRRSLSGQRELIVSRTTIVTPLAADQLRAAGIRISRQEAQTQAGAEGTWGYALEQPQPTVTTVLQSLVREGLRLQPLQASGKEPGVWARSVAECVARGACQGGVVFCVDAGLVCCVANKVKGVRAVAVLNVVQAGRAVSSIGANLLAVEMPGRTLFEIRQIVRCLTRPATCPAAVACILEELEDAHR